MIEHYRRTDGEWIYSSVSGMDAVLEIASISRSLKLNDIYDDVQIPTEAGA